MRKTIERLINSNVSPLEVSLKTGIPQNTAYRIFRGEASLDNVTLKNAEKLYNYQKGMDEMKGLKKEQAQLAYEIIKEETKGKLSEGVYLQVFTSLDEMLNDFNLTTEEAEENKSFIHDEIPQGPFILKDYKQEDFVFLSEFDETSVNNFIETITLP